MNGLLLVVLTAPCASVYSAAAEVPIREDIPVPSLLARTLLPLKRLVKPSRVSKKEQPKVT